MSVTVDHQPLAAEQMGLKTVGQLLSHLKSQNRLVVQVLIDGEEPDLAQISSLRQRLIAGHTLFVETTEPREMAMDVLNDVLSQLDEAERLKGDTIQLLQSNQHTKAFEKLAGVFTLWQHIQNSVRQIAELLKLDLNLVLVDGQTFASIISQLSDHLRAIKVSLENRDFVTLADVLQFEMETTTSQWRSAIDEVRDVVE